MLHKEEKNTIDSMKCNLTYHVPIAQDYSATQNLYPQTNFRLLKVSFGYSSLAATATDEPLVGHCPKQMVLIQSNIFAQTPTMLMSGLSRRDIDDLSGTELVDFNRARN